MQFDSEKTVFPISMALHIPDRAFAFGFIMAIRQIRPRPSKDKDAAWSVGVKRVGEAGFTCIASGKVGEASLWHAPSLVVLLQPQDQVMIQIEKDQTTGNFKDVVLVVDGTGEFAS